MVELPGCLERSTLGDVLGALHRERVSGTLHLHEVGAGHEHQHLIVWRDGLIHHVETTRAASVRRPVPRPPRQVVEHWTEDDARRTELLERLEALFQLTHAKLSFRVMGQRPVSAPVPLGPSEFLHGRRRSRDAENDTPRPAALAPESPRAVALRTLGLRGEPGADAVRAAFRQLARRWHPDRHPGASERGRATLCQRFAQITNAYEQLIGHPGSS